MKERQVPRNKMTFSQAEGIEPVPEPMALGQLSEDLRISLWNLTYEKLRKSISKHPRFNHVYLINPWYQILYDHHVFSLHKSADEFSNMFSTNAEITKSLFIKGAFNKVLDFLEFVFRHRSCPSGFSYTIEEALRQHKCSYTITLIEGIPTIVPITLPEQAESFKKDFHMLESGPFGGARSHLRTSATYINNGDFAGSIRESIHAVESIARCLSPNGATSLKAALKILSGKGVTLHPALEQGIIKFYGYTSDQDGIRHAMLENQTSDVNEEEAVFMFGACVSFSAYLVSKARKVGLFSG